MSATRAIEKPVDRRSLVTESRKIGARVIHRQKLNGVGGFPTPERDWFWRAYKAGLQILNTNFSN